MAETIEEAVEQLHKAAYREGLGPANGVHVWVRHLRAVLSDRVTAAMEVERLQALVTSSEQQRYRDCDALRAKLSALAGPLGRVREFVENEAENREATGSLMSDYEGEAKEALAELDAVLASLDRTVPAEEVKPGEIRVRDGVRERFIEHDDRGEVWEVLESILVENGPALPAEGEGKADERAWQKRCEQVEFALSQLSRATRRVLDAKEAWRSPDRDSHPNLVLEEAEAWIGLSKCFDPHASPSQEPQDARRERYARIIDPSAWTFYDRHIANPIMGAECRGEVGPSLAKADAILNSEGTRREKIADRIIRRLFAAPRDHVIERQAVLDVLNSEGAGS